MRSRSLLFIFSITFLLSLIYSNIVNSKTLTKSNREILEIIKSGNSVSALQKILPFAKKGDSFAQFYLGQMYRLGLHVNENHQESFKWYRKSAKQGYSSAQFYLGNFYLRGTGTPVDIQKATKWYIKAANQGHVIAQYHLGRMYQRGDGVSSNNEKAAKWFNKAANQGYILAQYKLGLIYISGDGVSKNNIQAHMWLNLSSIIGKNTIASILIDSIEKEMTTSQIQKANTLAKEWLKQINLHEN